MEIHILSPAAPLPVQRAWVLSMSIRSFKGRRDVEVHLFRPAWSAEEEEALAAALEGPGQAGIIGEPLAPGAGGDPSGSRRIILEAFTAGERDQIVDYLKTHYTSRLSGLTCAPLDFPVPLGLTPLSAMDEGKSIGLIRFERIPHFALPFPVRGLYDLGQHRPIVDAVAQAEG